MGTCSRRDFLDLLGAVGGSAATYRMATAASVVVNALHADAQDIGTSDATAFKTATELARMIRDKEISSIELTQYFIDRIEQFDAKLNAVIVRDFDRALAAARVADDALMRGELAGPLHGLPMTIKEAYDIAGLPTTCGFPEFADNIAEKDAAVVSRFKAAGAHFMGKTNVPMALGDIQTYNEIYGTTNNPWNIELTPGGSSGGTAAALAAGLTALDSGSDIGGSIRNPAHFCGVYGHKPTWGIVPIQGHGLPGWDAAPDLAVVGPLARSAADLALALKVVAGSGELNAPGWQLRLREPRAKTLKNFRVAVWATDDISPADQVIAERIQEVADTLARLGAAVSDSARPEFSARDSHETYVNLLVSLTASGVPDEVYEQNKKHADGFEADDMSPAAFGARAAVLDHRSWLYHHNIRTQIRMQWKRFFEDWDIVICPITVTTAFRHDHRPIEERTMLVNGVETPYFDQIFWAGLATVAYLPSTVFPTGLSENGLPIGIQAIGAEFADRTTIEFARLMAHELGGFTPPTGYED